MRTADGLGEQGPTSLLRPSWSASSSIQKQRATAPFDRFWNDETSVCGFSALEENRHPK
jgi:hypothetical protein